MNGTIEWWQNRYGEYLKYKDVQKRDILHLANGYIMVDTACTIDSGWEVLVFDCDKDGNITNWHELYKRHYPDIETAYKAHDELIMQWESR